MREPALPPVNVKMIARVALAFVALATISVLFVTFGPLRDRRSPSPPQIAQAPASVASGANTSVSPAVAADPTGPGPALNSQQPSGAADRRAGGSPLPMENQPPAMPASDRPALPAAGAGDVQGKSPAFDVVRMEPNGEAVIAGRGEPNVAIELLLDDGKGGAPQVLQRAITDNAGLFAFTNGPLPAGSHVLSLRTGSEAAGWMVSPQVVNVTINPPGAPLVALVAPDRPSVVLSSPDQKPVDSSASSAAPKPVQPDTAGQAGSAPKAAAAHVANSGGAASGARVAQVETDSSGRLFVIGKARPGATVRLYLNDALLASGVAKPGGFVEFAMESKLPEGAYRIRLDEIDPATGKVLSRAEAPWDSKPGGLHTSSAAGAARAGSTQNPARRTQPSDSAVKTGPVRTHVVSPGDSLWSISRNTYQLGSRYTTIYDANQSQIADADRIYPGQVFVLPSAVSGQASEK